MTHLLLFVAGLAALVLGANVLVRGASKLALSFGISPLVVGLTVVAFGTSAPEVAVSVGAVIAGQDDVATGNVVGSNILNVLLILGVSALIVPLTVNVQLVRQEVPIMIGVSLLLLVLGMDGALSYRDGLLLAALLVAYTAFLILQSRRETTRAGDYEAELKSSARVAWDSTPLVQVALVGAGLALLVLGADWLVDASIAFARSIGVSEIVIGLTIVALGTSMPEVATSIVAALKGERDIAVGNVIGSNTFNILGCLGASALISGSTGLALAPSLLAFDMWVMLAVAFACLPVFLTGREIARWEGAVFACYYVVYVVYLILAAKEHDALEPYSATMMSFVVPLTIITLIVSLIRRRPE